MEQYRLSEDIDRASALSQPQHPQPVSASATTSVSASFSSKLRRPWRTILWPSARRTRILMPLLLSALCLFEWCGESNLSPLALFRFNVYVSADLMESLADTEKAEPLVSLAAGAYSGGIESYPVVYNSNP